MSRYKLTKPHRLVATVMVVTLIPTLLLGFTNKAKSTPQIPPDTYQPAITAFTTQSKVQAVNESYQDQIRDLKAKEHAGYIDYMVSNFDVKPERAQLIVNSIESTGTKLPTSLILAMIQRETKFKNILANSSIEDSAGYVQMKSKTIAWVKKINPSLPVVKSQNEFLSSPSTQITYMVKYLEYANEQYQGNFTWTVSSYNMGLNSTQINADYVNEVALNKGTIEQFINRM